MKLTVTTLRFPIFVIRSKYQIIQNSTRIELNGPIDKFLIDDSSAPGDSLGERRLHLEINGESLYPLKYCLFTKRDLFLSKYTHFIDSNGKFFRYKRSMSFKTSCAEIRQIVNNEDSAFIKLADFPFYVEWDNILVPGQDLYLIYAVVDTHGVLPLYTSRYPEESYRFKI